MRGCYTSPVVWNWFLPSTGSIGLCKLHAVWRFSFTLLQVPVKHLGFLKRKTMVVNLVSYSLVLPTITLGTYPNPPRDAGSSAPGLWTSFRIGESESQPKPSECFRISSVCSRIGRWEGVDELLPIRGAAFLFLFQGPERSESCIQIGAILAARGRQ